MSISQSDAIKPLFAPAQAMAGPNVAWADVQLGKAHIDASSCVELDRGMQRLRMSTVGVAESHSAREPSAAASPADIVSKP